MDTNNFNMNKKEIWIGAGVVLVVIILAFVLGSRHSANAPSQQSLSSSDVEQRVVGDSGNLDLQNGNYNINGESFTLSDGAVDLPDSKVALLEGPAFADVNGDNIKDAVVLLRRTFDNKASYYVAAVLAGNSGQVSTNSIYLGDYIRISSISVDAGVITLSTLERNTGQALTVEPTVPVTHKYVVEGSQLSELK